MLLQRWLEKCFQNSLQHLTSCLLIAYKPHRGLVHVTCNISNQLTDPSSFALPRREGQECNWILSSLFRGKEPNSLPVIFWLSGYTSKCVISLSYLWICCDPKDLVVLIYKQSDSNWLEFLLILFLSIKRMASWPVKIQRGQGRPSPNSSLFRLWSSGWSNSKCPPKALHYWHLI